ncbi:MAG: 2Fe-2S iron-sulfur cluster-binding protein, partial [Holophaga sp.]|nr:2Fe-2S iron-sulfur cluster-binding protein [Holophaga sp.]
MDFFLNGQPKTFEGAPSLTVLTWLREVAGIISAKDGCSGEGVCGCCTILVDGAARMSCRLKMKDIAGKRLTTLEGLPVFEQNV